MSLVHEPDFKVGCGANFHETVEDFEAKIEAELEGTITISDPVSLGFGSGLDSSDLNHGGLDGYLDSGLMQHQGFSSVAVFFGLIPRSPYVLKQAFRRSFSFKESFK